MALSYLRVRSASVDLIASVVRLVLAGDVTVSLYYAGHMLYCSVYCVGRRYNSKFAGLMLFCQLNFL